MREKCIGTKKNGEPCKAWSKIDSEYCRTHAPEKIPGLVDLATQETEIKTTVEEKKETSRPWNSDNNPWARDMLKTKSRRSGYHCRWVAPDNIQKYLDQEYTFADQDHYKGVSDRVVGEEGKLDTKVKRRELTLMELPLELKAKRDEYINYKTNLRSAQISADLKKQRAKFAEEMGDDPQLTDKRTSVRGR